MNTLSWLLYLSEVAGRVGGIAAVLAALGGSVGAALFAIGRLVPWDGYFGEPDEEVGKLAVRDKIGNTGKTLIIVAASCLALSAVAPSKQTLYLIAASQAGEVVVKSDEAKEIMSGLKDIIKGQIATAAKGASE